MWCRAIEKFVRVKFSNFRDELRTTMFLDMHLVQRELGGAMSLFRSRALLNSQAKLLHYRAVPLEA